MKRLTGGRGVDVVYDSVGKTTAEKSLDCLVPRGMMVFYGNASGPVPPIDPLVLSRKGSLFLTRPTLVHYIADRASLEARAADVLGDAAAGRLEVRIDRIYPARGGGRGPPRPRGTADDGQGAARPVGRKHHAEETVRAAVTEAFGGIDRVVVRDLPGPFPVRAKSSSA